jgi:hypothetical protein
MISSPFSQYRFNNQYPFHGEPVPYKGELTLQFVLKFYFLPYGSDISYSDKNYSFFLANEYVNTTVVPCQL